METSIINKMTGFVIALVIGSILVGGMLAPTVAGIQDTVGDKVTLQNAAIADNFNYEKWNGEAITFSFAGGHYDASVINEKYLINGQDSELVFNNVYQRILFASDKVCLRVAGGAPTAITVDLQYYGYDGRVQEPEFNLVINAGGEYTLTISPSSANPTIIAGTISWLVYAIPSGDMNILQLQNTQNPFYTSKSSDIIVLGNVYTTGENDTFYSYYNGDLTVNEEYAGVSNVSITKTLKAGYTDIYDTTISVNVGDETFTPFHILAPKNVVGHESSGAYYVMFGVLTLLAIVMLVVVSANAIRNKY